MEYLNLNKTLIFIAQRWYGLVVGMLAGGLLAFGLSYFIPPLYESHAVFSVTIDYTQTGMLTDVEEDQAMRGVGSVIFSDETTTATLQELAQTGLNLSKDEFYDDAVFDREEFRWAIRYRDPDPQNAFQVVGAWSGQADAFLQDSLEHARVAAAYQRQLNGLVECLQRTAQEEASSNFCSPQKSDQLITEIQRYSKLISAELAQSRALFSAVAVELVKHAYVPSQPVRAQKNVLVLNGAFIGGLLSGLFLLLKYRSMHSSENG